MEQFEKIMKEHSMMREQIQTLTKEIEIWREACQQQEARNYDWLYDAKVINVVDGDTFDAEVMVGFDITVTLRFRLSGVDTPEIHGVPRESQEWQAGQRAFKRVKELLEGHVVTLETIKDKKGKYIVHDPYWGANIFLDSTRALVSALYDSGTVIDQMIIYHEK